MADMDDEPEVGVAATDGPEPRVLGAGGFPEVARLELDDLLEQLISRARDVQATQGRLRALLRANLTVASAVDLNEVLGHILDAARRLVDAEYAALGLIEQGRLVRFIHAGMNDATVAAIGHLPEGKGLLGRLIDYPSPLRLADIATHRSSVGFPDQHPPMRSFLGVPIRVADRIFGNLYLTNKRGATEFGPDDEELVNALAAMAGAAITNAATFEDSQRRYRWQAAMAAVSTAVLTMDTATDASERVSRQAFETAAAAGVCVCIPLDDGDERLRVGAALGVYGDRLGQEYAVEGTVYGQAMAQRQPVVIVDPANDERMTGPTAGIGPTVAIPMLTELAADGVLFLCRSPGDAPFDKLDIELLTAFANHSALVLQLARAREDNEQLRLVDDRRRIAEDIRDRVIQRLSRLGLDLHGVAARVSDPKVRAGLHDSVVETDEIIRALREAIFALTADPTS